MNISSSARLWWALIGIVLLSLNLRPGATSLGPVLAEVKAGLGMGGAVAGLITALPGLCFAVFGALAVAISLRLGLTGALAAGVTATAIGLLLRPFVGSVAPFLLLSIVAFAGMAIGNVLMPAFVKKTFPNRLAGVMSVYTIALAIGATTASMIAVPLLEAGGPQGWRVSLGVWGVVAAAAAVVWWALAASERRRRVPVDADAPKRSGSVFAVVGSRKAIGMAVFFGTQSMQAYVQFGWIAQMYRDGGLDPLQAGIMASIIPGFGIPAGFIMPTVAQRMKDPPHRHRAGTAARGRLHRHLARAHRGPGAVGGAAGPGRVLVPVRAGAVHHPYPRPAHHHAGLGLRPVGRLPVLRRGPVHRRHAVRGDGELDDAVVVPAVHRLPGHGLGAGGGQARLRR